MSDDDVDEAIRTLREILTPPELCTLARLFDQRRLAGYGRVIVVWHNRRLYGFESVDTYVTKDINWNYYYDDKPKPPGA